MTRTRLSYLRPRHAVIVGVAFIVEVVLLGSVALFVDAILLFGILLVAMLLSSLRTQHLANRLQRSIFLIKHQCDHLLIFNYLINPEDNLNQA